MAVLNTNSSFVSWVLTPTELVQGTLLSSLQKQCIQNQIWQAAEEKIKLPFTDENKQREAELQGRILALQSLLDLSEEAEKETNQEPINIQTQES
jgi:hypothetical protein